MTTLADVTGFQSFWFSMVSNSLEIRSNPCDKETLIELLSVAKALLVLRVLVVLRG
ncbi:MAG: hypothetical protein OXI96_09500 [Acidimicrobiaceae bacterium]|nr:hypothetical protein [Acidimicrobiaceae bacterium]